MNTPGSDLQILDLQIYPAFAQRPIQPRDGNRQAIGLERLARAFLQESDAIVQELVNTAVELCGADSAGISLLHDGLDEPYYSEPQGCEWVATAGDHRAFFTAMLPRVLSACSITLERGRPQHFRVSKQFSDVNGIGPDCVTDGLLLPWNAGGLRGTIWILAHGRTEAFDQQDLGLMEMFARFAALGIAIQEDQCRLRGQWALMAASAVNDQLARQINSPLQLLSDLVFVAASGMSSGDAKDLAMRLSNPLQELSELVEKVFGPSGSGRPN